MGSFIFVIIIALALCCGIILLLKTLKLQNPISLPRKVRTVAVITALLGLSLIWPRLGFGWFLISTFKFLSGPVILLPIPLFLITSYGLWRFQKWAAILTLIMYSLLSIVLIYGLIMISIDAIISIYGIGSLVFAIPLFVLLLVFLFCSVVVWRFVTASSK